MNAGRCPPTAAGSKNVKKCRRLAHRKHYRPFSILKTLRQSARGCDVKAASTISRFSGDQRAVERCSPVVQSLTWPYRATDVYGCAQPRTNLESRSGFVRVRLRPSARILDLLARLGKKYTTLLSSDDVSVANRSAQMPTCSM